MSFVHKDTGADAAVTARDEHEMRWMRIPEATYNIAAVGQPGNHLREFGNVKCVDYYTCLEWASHACRQQADWEGKGFFKHRPSPSGLARGLHTALAALPAGYVKKPLTKGEWLRTIEKGATAVDSTNAGELNIQVTEIFELAVACNPPGALASGADAAAIAAHEAKELESWSQDSGYVRYISWGDLARAHDRSFPTGGWLAWVCANDGSAKLQGRSGPLGKLATSILKTFKPGGADTVTSNI